MIATWSQSDTPVSCLHKTYSIVRAKLCLNSVEPLGGVKHQKTHFIPSAKTDCVLALDANGC